MKAPDSPRLFLVDGYALIYRAFFALISRPLTTSKGENTSASWGIANFLQRLITKHQPEYLGWVHDSGLSFRHERYPAYKATREKLTEELQSDFDAGLMHPPDSRRIPIPFSPYPATNRDVIGTLGARSVESCVHVVVISATRFPAAGEAGCGAQSRRGGPQRRKYCVEWRTLRAAGSSPGIREDTWRSFEFVDNIPGSVESRQDGSGSSSSTDTRVILAHASAITKKDRWKLLDLPGRAAFKGISTNRDDLAVPSIWNRENESRIPASAKYLRELEFHIARLRPSCAGGEKSPPVSYQTVDHRAARALARAREVERSHRTNLINAAAACDDPLRSSLVSIPAVG